ncbi:hypothetical protein EUTSA_v10004420mg [Eutrema salsugineum]|uniref:Myb-like domain-containing protein n=1 Tax=Eutrema salsugineum TaxID=72664 RepID=V4K4Q1_EUTSA|nr:hypothetical protein EUTSA_v10004420mg [Eutrema salsugineum]
MYYALFFHNFLSQDEANEIFGSGLSTTHCDPQCDSDVPHKKRHCLGKSETDRGGSETLNFDACIVCDISDKWVSRCCGIDCILSFHGECLNAEMGSSDDPANSYCPYCWFKFLVSKQKAMREKAVGAEKEVSKRMFPNMKRIHHTTFYGGETGNQDHSIDSTDVVSDEELQGEKDDCSSKEEQVQVEMDSDKSSDEVEASGGEERVDTEKFQDAEDDKDDETAKGQDQIQQNEKRTRRRRLILKDIDSEISSNESTSEWNGEDVTEQSTSSAQIVNSPSRKMKNQQRKHNGTTKVRVASWICRNISFFKKDQRRRLFWTSEEEEMLKVGVEKFAPEAKKNMPWKKILEMGEKVFHETRTPSDLKDKWRNMNGRH